MIRFSSLTGLLLTLALLGACSNKPYVVTDYLSGYDFSALKTYHVAEARQETKDEILISPFTFSHIHSVIDRELAQSYQQAPAETKPDFLVNYHIVIEEKLDPGTYDRLYGYGYYGRGYRYYYPAPLFYGTTGSPRVYNQGSLIVDIVDAKTEKPIWRGVSEKRLRSGLTPQEQREILTSAVIEIINKFPPM
ncbi:MAG TPA: DUF4136 domain-containing protein [Cellvibrio sp.]|nr:DUF4136 domain-containing protein [Cellvibrio sp.]